MPHRKQFQQPFWALVILTIIITIYSVYSFSYLNTNGRVPTNHLKELGWRFTTTVIVLIIECVIYYKISTRNLIPWLAWCHIILLYFALIGAPVVIAVGINLASANYSQEEYVDFIISLSRIRTILYWGCLLAAHIFFIAAIIKALTSANTSSNPPNEPADLLDEFAP